MDLADIRQAIDGIDTTLLRSFVERMDIATEVAKSKIEMGKAVFDPARERSKLNNLASRAPERYEAQTITMFRLLMSMSKAEQQRYINELKGITVSQKAHATAVGFDTPFPQTASVACQGVEGAYSEQACARLFKRPSPFFFSSFEAVFSAIEKGLCRYGVLPLENSTAGSVNAVYDLMTQHNFRIVRSVRIKVDHNLLANPGAKLENIREIYSHEQAISQCAHFLQGFPNVKVIRCENTAVAARMVAESGRDDVAALSSRACRELYGLDCLAASVQDQGNNFTRFICIAKNLEIYPGADRTSLMMVLPHHPGSLYKVLSRFNALGVNMNKLESRPMPDRNFEFMFYFDLETSVYAPQFTQLMGELPELCEEFTYLGSYSEVV